MKLFLSLILICVILFGGFSLYQSRVDKKMADLVLGNGQATTTAYIPPTFSYDFRFPGMIEEAGDSTESTSPYWWVNSGGGFVIKDGVGQTLQGDLGTESKWRNLYAKANATDTDSGLHPQNIFRLVFRGALENFRQEAYFKIAKDVPSASPNRNESNGLLLFNRYKDGQDLYYAGIRVDGFAVIKKKLKSEYTTLAYQPVFEGMYDKVKKENLIPKDLWIGLRTEIMTLPDNSVSIKLFMDRGALGKWVLVAEVIDTNEPIRGSGHLGIRTDFMDVLIKDYSIQTLPSFVISE